MSTICSSISERRDNLPISIRTHKNTAHIHGIDINDILYENRLYLYTDHIIKIVYDVM